MAFVRPIPTDSFTKTAVPPRSDSQLEEAEESR